MNYKLCFILDHWLYDYRIPLFDEMKKKGHTITVIHPGRRIPCSIDQVILKPFKFLGFEYRNLPDLNDFDIVVHMQNLRMVSLWTQTLNPFREYKIVHWGIGVSSAKGLKKEKSLISRIRNFLTNKADGMVLYSEYALDLFSISVRSKTFIANNTIHNPICVDFSIEKKEHFLFIGTFNKRKGLDTLLNCFAEYLDQFSDSEIRKLVLIGEGPEKDIIRRLANDLKISEFVDFVGRINDGHQKAKYFKNAIASFSLNQAGLSILESFSYGVPFVCFENAISGGEHLNIINGLNGFLAKNKEEVVKYMGLFTKDPELARQLGANAFRHYSEERNIRVMANAFEECFDYAIKSKIVQEK